MNVDFNSPSLYLLGSRKSAHKGIKERYPQKVVILPLLASLAWKRLQIGMDILPITTSSSDELFSHINVSGFERPWTVLLFFLQSSTVLHTSRVNCEEVAGDKLRQFASRNCYRFSRISWALAQISCYHYHQHYYGYMCTAAWYHGSSGAGDLSTHWECHRFIRDFNLLRQSRVHLREASQPEGTQYDFSGTTDRRTYWLRPVLDVTYLWKSS